MAGLIDYAGVFPPANLPLPEAVANYAAYLRQPDRWMLSRFILPAARLSQLIPDQLALFDADHPLALSLLGRGGDNGDGFLQGLRADLDALLAMCDRYAPRLVCNVYEVRLPPGDDLPALLTEAHALLQVANLRPFYEIPFDAAWDDRLQPTIAGIGMHNARIQDQAGFKLRSGGVTPAAFPTLAQVTAAIVACRDAQVPLKATAGLHHPFRHFSLEVNAPMHGFINLFGAAILAHVHRLTDVDIIPILADENPASFSFHETHFAWGDLSATTAEIRALRQSALLSFGSCSFDEPRHDLQRQLH